MKISILTLFPEMFAGVFSHSIIKLAQEKGAVSLNFVNIRNFGIGKHKLVDDTPYGGGAGMVMRVDVIASALAQITNHSASWRTQITNRERIILLDPQGEKLTQKKVQELSKYDHLILVCGRYEGVDERVRALVDEEISIGDYVLTGGEIPSMVVIDAIVRLIPGVIKKDSALHESFSSLLLEYPQYTRPSVFKRKKVPAILLSGDHAKIAAWREKKSVKKTEKRRPDLLKLG